MKAVIGAMVLALAPSLAAAQYVNPYAPKPPESPYTVRDRSSGNVYRVTPQYGGGATVRGNNYETGSTWRTTIQPNGNQRGTDADGNMWSYNPRSGAYMSSDGTTCIGKGELRTCSK